MLHRAAELVAVLGHLDRGERGADQLHAVAREHPAARQLDREVERRLAAHGGQQRVRALVLDHALGDLRRQRLDVRAVGEFRVRHDRRRVRIEEHDLDPEPAQRAARLGARVVELARLADHDRPGAEDQHLLEIGADGHQ